MPIAIETFSNHHGGSSFFKAIGHPKATASIRTLLDKLQTARSVALYDIHGFAAGFAELFPLSGVALCGVFVQDLQTIGQSVLNHVTQPITNLPDSGCDLVFIASFDTEYLLLQFQHLIPSDVAIISLDAVRLPQTMLTNSRRYLDPLNFATNFALMREGNGHHTRLVTANYWAGYGAYGVRLWFLLLDAHGKTLAEWEQKLPDTVATVTIDSAILRNRFNLGDFCGSLFIHALGIAGHDVVKYALDTYGDTSAILSCTHDANAWPADFYAGLPAPRPEEQVLLWIQNSHPTPIPSGAIGLNRMGCDDRISWLDEAIPAFGTRSVDTRTLLPQVSWPQQIEIQAGKHFVRPRYEVVWHNGGERRRIAHANVERSDLEPDPQLSALRPLIGKGYILPAPIMPLARYRSIVLPTPMTRAQKELPLALLIYDRMGREISRHALGHMPRTEVLAFTIDTSFCAGLERDLAGNNGQAYGHMELLYDLSDGGEADGWLHGLFRYEDRMTGHAAETSFGSHIFNTVLTYRNEPQSYAGPAPGLRTRLFLRLGPEGSETLCHLIYPASTSWHACSQTYLELMDCDGQMIAQQKLQIPCNGSHLWRVCDLFSGEERAAARGGYVLIRDTTCRLFGYHGLETDQAFSLDHMFGF